KIGEGGMGEVYLAEDKQLHRKVALKILPAELTQNKDRLRRFELEAQSAAALNHPHIAHIYEIGKADGVHFIAMEFVDGLTLRQLIDEQQTDLTKLLRHLQHAAPMKLSEVLDVAIQTSSAFSAAHAAGIVHRDLKPENVLPLMNASNDPNTEYLSDGISEALIYSLTELRQLRVTARATAFHYKGKEIDPQAVGRELNVQAVLMARVRQSGDALNIQVDLVDTKQVRSYGARSTRARSRTCSRSSRRL